MKVQRGFCNARVPRAELELRSPPAYNILRIFIHERNYIRYNQGEAYTSEVRPRQAKTVASLAPASPPASMVLLIFDLYTGGATLPRLEEFFESISGSWTTLNQNFWRKNEKTSIQENHTNATFE
jgi:hypothetical protein